MSAQQTGFAQTEARVLVPPGLYDVAFERYYTWMMFGRAPKLTICFRIVTMGPHFEQKLQRHYNISKLIGRPGTNGRFKVGFCSDFLREFATLFGAPTRLDRIPMSNFEKHILIAKVRTVSKGSGQRDIPQGLQYSTIAELTGIRQ
jgi:hypothetical protein